MNESILDRPDLAEEPPPSCVLVAGASGGIGSAFCKQIVQCYPNARIIRMARDPASLAPLSRESVDVQLDIAEEQQIKNAIALTPETPLIDWIFIATGWLHDAEYKPEKTYRSLDADHLLHAYRINAVGPALLLKHLIPRLNPGNACKIGIISARVGSISDNRLGGWHAYRASKAALNMLIKNLAIELGRKKTPHIIAGLQPGTTDTALSAPFQRNLRDNQLQTPEYTATQLVQVMRKLAVEDSGGLFDFLGMPFTP